MTSSGLLRDTGHGQLWTKRLSSGRDSVSAGWTLVRRPVWMNTLNMSCLCSTAVSSTSPPAPARVGSSSSTGWERFHLGWTCPLVSHGPNKLMFCLKPVFTAFLTAVTSSFFKRWNVTTTFCLYCFFLNPCYHVSCPLGSREKWCPKTELCLAFCLAQQMQMGWCGEKSCTCALAIFNLIM